MSGIENEIVSFTARVNLDEQTAKQVEAAFANINRSADEARARIEQTNAALMKMRMEGKENTAEFKALEASLNADVKALKALTKQGDAYAKQLGVEKMSMKQLKEHAKQLRKEMEGMHDTKRLAAYQKELKATEARIAELGGGIRKTGSILGGLSKRLIPTFDVVSFGLKAVHGLVKIGQKVWSDLKTETQKWGDAIQVEIAAADAVWHHFIRNISAGRDEITLSYQEVAKLAREAARLKDEIFELQNSYKILEAEATPRMQELEAVFRDTSKPIAERKAALEEMKQIELGLAADRLVIAQQEEDAAYDRFRIQTGLDRDAAESFIKNYLEAKKSGLVEEAEAYNRLIGLEEYYQSVMTSGAMLSSKTYRDINGRLKDVRTQIAGTRQEVIDFAGTLSQYNLGNDSVTGDYANAVAGRKGAEAAADPSAMNKKYARLNGQLSGGKGQGGTATPGQKEMKALEDLYKKQLLALKQSLASQEITQSKYDAKALTLQEMNIRAKIALAQRYKQDTTEMETQLADLRIAQNKKMAAVLAKTDEEFLKQQEKDAKETDAFIEQMLAEEEAAIEEEIADSADALASHYADLFDKARSEVRSRGERVSVVKANLDTEMAALEEMHEMQMISEEEYLARKKHLHAEAAKEIAAINVEAWQNAFDTASEILSQMSELTTTLQEAEFAQVEAWKEKELALAGDNAERQTQIEEETEAKKLEIQKKYADTDMAINIAKALAAGALAAIQAWNAAGGNPVIAGIFTALIAATTAAQVATIVAQRNAIKNTSASSSSGSGEGTTGTVGFSEGGYTGKGGRLEVAGVVHRGEYVVPQPQMRDPEVARMVASIESKRRRTSSKNALPGYAEGGYTGTDEEKRYSSVLDDIYDLLYTIAGNPIPAYVVLSDLETKYDQQDRFRALTSLKYRKP